MKGSRRGVTGCLGPTRDCVDTVLPSAFGNRVPQSDVCFPFLAVVAAGYPKRDLFPSAVDANIDILAMRYLRPYLVIGIQCAREGNPTVGHRTVTAAQTGGCCPGCHIDDVTVLS